MYGDDILDLTVREALKRGFHLVKTGKLDEDQVRTIKRLLNEGYAQKSIAERFGVTIGTISHIATGRRWGHVV